MTSDEAAGLRPGDRVRAIASGLSGIPYQRGEVGMVATQEAPPYEGFFSVELSDGRQTGIVMPANWERTEAAQAAGGET